MSYINKENLLATINEVWERKYSNCDLKAVYDVYRMIVKKINGAEEIVKCKHCKYADDACAYGLVCNCECGMTGAFVAENDFCSSGKRRK